MFNKNPIHEKSFDELYTSAEIYLKRLNKVAHSKFGMVVYVEPDGK